MTLSPVGLGFSVLMVGMSFITLPSLTRERGGTIIPTNPQDAVEILSRNGYDCPDGLLWRPDGIYIADEGGGRLRKWTATGTAELHTRTPAIESPEDLAMDEAGNTYFTDDSTGRVWKRSSAGELVLLAGPKEGLRSTEGIALMPNGHLAVGDGELHAIYEVTQSGKVTEMVKDIRKPESLTYDDEGGLYVADNEDNVIYYLREGQRTVVLSDPKISPETILWTPSGLLITDSREGRLYRWKRGEPVHVLASFGGVLRKVHGVTIDQAGAIYVSIQSDLAHRKGYIVRLTPAAPPTMVSAR